MPAIYLSVPLMYNFLPTDFSHQNTESLLLFVVFQFIFCVKIQNVVYVRRETSSSNGKVVKASHLSLKMCRMFQVLGACCTCLLMFTEFHSPLHHRQLTHMKLTALPNLSQLYSLAQSVEQAAHVWRLHSSPQWPQFESRWWLFA